MEEEDDKSKFGITKNGKGQKETFYHRLPGMDLIY